MRAAQCPKRKKNEWNKWKNHFYEMKGDVGMSLHEKERNKMPTPRHKVTHNPIPTSLFLPRLQRTFSCRQLDVKMLCCLLCLHNKQTNKQHVKAKRRCRDGVMSDFVSWCRHLVPFFFMKLHPYIPLHFIEMIFPLVYMHTPCVMYVCVNL